MLMLELKSFHRPGLCLGDERSENRNKDSQNDDTINGKNDGKELSWNCARLFVSISTGGTAVQEYGKLLSW